MTVASLRSKRLILRPFGPEHFDEFYNACVTDPAVMEFWRAFPAGTRPTEAARRDRARKDFLDRFEAGAGLHGYITWVLKPAPALDSSPFAFVGWCGILSPVLDHQMLGPELAFMLASRWQGLGLATEAASAVIADAWSRYGLVRLHALTDPPNLASRRVLERLGFSEHGLVAAYGRLDMVLYTLARAAA